MKKNEGFEFIPKKWLGDAHVIAMDWDCRAMHLHLMAIAWQKEPRGYLVDDDKIIQKLLSIQDIEDWVNRIKPQIFAAWEKTFILVDNIERIYWVQPGLVSTFKKITSVKDSSAPKVIKKRKVKLEELEENSPFDGFPLSSLARLSPKTTILFVPSTKEQNSNIWTLGVTLLTKNGEEEKSARGVLSRWIKKYGANEVATVIAEMSIKNIQPANIISFLTKILEDRIRNKKPNKVSVSL